VDSQDSPEITEETFLAAFQTLDRNADGVLTEAEVDQAVIERWLEPGLAEIVAILKSEFTEIKTLGEIKTKPKTSDSVRIEGLTSSDVLSLARILVEHVDELSAFDSCPESAITGEEMKIADPAVVSAIARDTVARVRSLTKRDLFLYKTGQDPIRSINVHAIKQGRVGNCAFLAALGSIVSVCPQLVATMIKNNGDGTFTVTFQGARREPITVDRPTIVELALYARITEWGYWPAVIEKAYGTFMKKRASGPKLIPAENTRGADYWPEIFRLLTGQEGKIEIFAESSPEKVVALLTKAFRDKRAITAWSGNSGGGSNARVSGNHAYSVVGWNEKLSRITLRNPWGYYEQPEPQSSSVASIHITNNEREREEEPRPEGFATGEFTLDLDTFLAKFYSIHYEEWVPLENTHDTDDDSHRHDDEPIKIHAAISFDRFAPSVVARFMYGLILIFSAGVLLYPPVGLLWRAYTSINWPVTSGKIEKIDYSVEADRFPGSVSDLDVQYTYEVARHRYTSSVVGGMADFLITDADVALKANYPPGKVVPVHYNPDKPEEACLMTGFQFFKTIVLGVWVLGGIVCALIGATFIFFHRFFTDAQKQYLERRKLWYGGKG